MNEKQSIIKKIMSWSEIGTLIPMALICLVCLIIKEPLNK